MRSVSQIWKDAKPGVSLKEWINYEKALYDKKMEGNKIDNDMDFDTWINKRYDPLNFAGTQMITKLKETGQKVSQSGVIPKTTTKSSPLLETIKQTAQKFTDSKTTTSATPEIITEPTVKTILGMKPVVFYTLTGTIVIISALLIYKKMKKK